MSPSTQPVDVLALSKVSLLSYMSSIFTCASMFINMPWNLLTFLVVQLTCLVLPNDQVHLLKPKSIWSADDAQEKHPLIERILQLDPIEVCTKKLLFFGKLLDLKF